MATAPVTVLTNLTHGGEARPYPKNKRVIAMPLNVGTPTSQTIQGSIPTRRLSVRPKSMRLGVIHSPQLQLKKAISVEISRKKDAVVANARDLQEFGCGVTMSDAIDDLSKGLAELFFRLESDQARLSKDLQKLWDKLSQYVQRRQSK